MTLRRRLAVTILLIAVPLVAGILWLRTDLRRRSLARSLREFALVTMQSGGREDCEAHPEVFPRRDGARHRQPPRLPPRQPHGAPPGRPVPPDRFELPGPPGPNDRPGPRDHAERSGPPGHPGPPHAPDHEPVDLWAYHADYHSSNPAAPTIPHALRAALEEGAASASESIPFRGRAGLRLLTRMPWSEGPCALVMVDSVVPDRLEEDGAILWGLIALCTGVLLAVLLAVGPIVRRIRRLQGEVARSAASKYEIPVEVKGRDEVADLARVFNEAGRDVRRHLAEVQEQEEALRAFVANTTHDVMIPLTVLQGHLAEQKRRLGRGEGADREALHACVEETHYIGSLLHNLGAVAKLEAGAEALARDAVDLNALVVRVVERHRPLAAARAIDFEYSVPDEIVSVTGDVTLLEQTVRNLVHNAVRYNDDDGHVSMLLRARDGTFSLRVLDDGPGVSEHQLQKLTERRFRSGTARTRAPAGSGLGLHIASDVAARHGFQLTFRNLEPHGLEAELSGPTAEQA